MGAVTLDKLYDNYNVLSDAKSNYAEFSEQYLEAIEGTKGGEKEKKLAAQIISKFFKHFPNLQHQAIEAVIDICEDDETGIRMAAIKELPLLCKDNKEYVSKIADILVQLLQLNDPLEYNVACNSLLEVVKIDPGRVIKCIFNKIYVMDNEGREKALKFIITKLKSLDKSIMSTEVEDLIIGECKKVLQDTTGKEYTDLMTYLVSSKVSNTLTGQQELLAIAIEQAELNKDFIVVDGKNNNADRLTGCISLVLPFFSAKLESTPFVKYICDQVLSQWDKFSKLSNGNTYQLIVAQQLAELSIHCGALENPSLYVVQIFDKLKFYMPRPPVDGDESSVPNFKFSFVESLLYGFHKLARQCPDFLTHDPQVLKDFRTRLMYLARGVQTYLKALNSQEKDACHPKDAEIIQTSPKLLNNINTLIKDLFYQPPIYKCNVELSFKTKSSYSIKRTNEQMSQKRHTPIIFDNTSSNKHVRSNRPGESVKLYAPPSGKFSNSFQNYDNDRKYGNSRFRGRGGRTVRGRGKPWRN